MGAGGHERHTSVLSYKTRLIIQRNIARQAGDAALLAEVDGELASLENLPEASDSTTDQLLRRLTDKNRASNREEVKKAEARAQEERRRQAAAIAKGAVDVKLDSSARIKTQTRFHYNHTRWVDLAAFLGAELTISSHRDDSSRVLEDGASPPTTRGGSAESPAVEGSQAGPSRSSASSRIEEEAAKMDLDVDLSF